MHVWRYNPWEKGRYSRWPWDEQFVTPWRVNIHPWLRLYSETDQHAPRALCGNSFSAFVFDRNRRYLNALWMSSWCIYKTLLLLGAYEWSLYRRLCLCVSVLFPAGDLRPTEILRSTSGHHGTPWFWEGLQSTVSVHTHTSVLQSLWGLSIDIVMPTPHFNPYHCNQKEALKIIIIIIK